MSLMEHSHCYFLPSFNIGHAQTLQIFFHCQHIRNVSFEGKSEDEKQIILFGLEISEEIPTFTAINYQP